MSSLWPGRMDMAEERLLVQYCSHLRTEALETAAHVRHSGCDPDPGPLAAGVCLPGEDARACGEINYPRHAHLEDRPYRGRIYLPSIQIRPSVARRVPRRLAMAALRCVHHRHRQQSHNVRVLCYQRALAMRPPPKKQQVQVGSVGRCNPGQRRSRHNCRLQDRSKRLLRA